MYKSRTASSNGEVAIVAGKATGFGKDGKDNDWVL